MNIKRFIPAVIAGFIFVFGTDFLIHGVWLKPAYDATASLWRTEAEMQARMPWLMAAQFIFAALFVLLWAKGFAKENCFKCALGFGAMMAVFQMTALMIQYATTPLPIDILVKWLAAGLIQGVLLGALTFFVYKPK